MAFIFVPGNSVVFFLFGCFFCFAVNLLASHNKEKTKVQ